MSTITHPRPTPSSSRRNSQNPITSPSSLHPAPVPVPSNPQQQQQRRTRTAQLRDYYGLKPPPVPAAAAVATTTNAASAASSVVGEDEQHDNDLSGVLPDSELDRGNEEGGGNFDAQAYVDRVLRDEDLQGVLKVEGRLVNEIRALDGEKKALVYDNYSKLIAAVETIRKMRTNMDPLGPTTSTLAPAVAHIAEMATGLAEKGVEPTVEREREKERSMSGVRADKREKQRETVRWVLSAPRRLRMMLVEGRREEAVQEWKDVLRLLDMWKGVEGVEEVRREGEQLLFAKEETER